MIEHNDLIKPLEAIKIYEEYNDIRTDAPYVLVITGVVCFLDFYFIYSTHVNFQDYCWRVKQYRKMLNKTPQIKEWYEDANQ